MYSLKDYFIKQFYQKIKWAVLFSGLALSGACAMFGGPVAQTLPPGGATTQSVMAACDSYAAVLVSLVPFKPKMSANEVAVINKADLLAHPICGTPSAYNASSALQAILAETANLKTILTTNKGAKP